MLSARRTKQMGNILWDMHFGQIVLNKPMIIITLMNFIILLSLKWDFDPTYYLLPFGLFAAYMLWFVGHFLNKMGVRKAFTEANFKNVKLGEEDENS